MDENDYKAWSEEYERFIYKDENGDWMFDEFGPTDEFSLARQLRRQQNNLRSERSTLKPKGSLPNDDESRFRATLDDDKDALQAAQIGEQIDNLEWQIQRELEQIQDELEQKKRSQEFSKRGKIGAEESKAVRQERMKRRHTDWKELAKKKHDRNPSQTPWETADKISAIYIEQGSAKSYSQRTIFEAIKKLECFQKKKY